MFSPANARAFHRQVQQALAAHKQNRVFERRSALTSDLLTGGVRPRTFQEDLEEIEAYNHGSGVTRFKRIDDLYRDVASTDRTARTWGISDRLEDVLSDTLFWDPEEMAECEGLTYLDHQFLLEESSGFGRSMFLMLFTQKDDTYQLVVVGRGDCSGSVVDRCFCGFPVYLSILLNRQDSFNVSDEYGIHVRYEIEVYTKPTTDFPMGADFDGVRTGSGVVDVMTNMDIDTFIEYNDESDPDESLELYVPFYRYYEAYNARWEEIRSPRTFEHLELVQVTCESLGIEFGNQVGDALLEYCDQYVGYPVDGFLSLGEWFYPYLSDFFRQKEAVFYEEECLVHLAGTGAPEPEGDPDPGESGTP